MKQFDATMNTQALDDTLIALFGVKGRDEAKRVYEALNASMAAVYQAGRDGRSDEVNGLAAEYVKKLEEQEAAHAVTIRDAERVGYDKGHAAALFAVAVEQMNAEAAEISPALAPTPAMPAGTVETAFVHEGQASALG